MIQIGQQITAVGDGLRKADIKDLFHAIRNPNVTILNKIQQLRIIRNIDAKQYTELKKKLPYFVCGIFNPNIRRKENFAYASCFVVDIDHISEKGLTMDAVRKKIEADTRVLLSFVSPGEDGLKVLFRLSERCYDAALFSLFYKAFLTDFSLRYGVQQVVDTRTSDVTRACFFSYDPAIYYNPESDTVDLKSIVDTENVSEMFRMKREQERMEQENTAEANHSAKKNVEVDGSVIQKIKQVLSDAPKPIDPPEVYIPPQLNEIIDDLRDFIAQTGTIVKEIINISYGKKIRASIGIKEAEVNLFYGKRGFTVVQSPRNGTSSEMNQMLADLVQAFLLTH